MPFRRLPSQPDARSHPWLRRQAGRQLLAAVQRMAIPELTRVFGQYGLYLRPSSEIAPELSGNMLRQVVSLYRSGQGLAGQLQCRDSDLPIESGSLSLVYALFALEGSADPEALMHEIARVLKPEGVALVISLNPWSLARLRWWSPSGRGAPASYVQRLAGDAGLDPVRCRHIGPFWPNAKAALSAEAGESWLDGFRVANLVVLRRREAGLTPLRRNHAAVSLRPGMSAG
jgi:SAM-dependent methyltransferase